MRDDRLPELGLLELTDLLSHARQSCGVPVASVVLAQEMIHYHNTHHRSNVMDPQATAGRIVHYYSTDSSEEGPRAAIVNRDTGPDGYAELTIFNDGWRNTIKVSYAEKPTRGCWSWMPYQRAKAETVQGNVSESAEPRPQPDDRSDDGDRFDGGGPGSGPEASR